MKEVFCSLHGLIPLMEIFLPPVDLIKRFESGEEKVNPGTRLMNSVKIPLSTPSHLLPESSDLFLSRAMQQEQ